MTLPLIAGLFNIVVGLMLAMSIVLMGGGFVVWLVRLGTYPTYRTEGIVLMQWSVAILFVIILLMAAVRLVQSYPGAIAAVLGVVLVGAIVWLLVQTFAKGEEKEEEH